MRLFAQPVSIFAVLALAACASSGGTAEPDSGVAAAPAPAAPAPAAQPAPEPAAAELTVSREQSNRGRNGFMAACTACHGASEFSDSSFKRRWQRRTAGALFDFISTSMPEDAPGSLAPERYVDIIAYFLGMNGFSMGNTGTELAADDLMSISLAPFSGG